MQRRDRQSEVVVAVIAVGVIAVALTFGIVLSLGNQDDENPAATPTIMVLDVIIADERPTIEATVVAQDVPTVTDLPSETPRPSATATDLPTEIVTQAPLDPPVTDLPPQIPTETPSETTMPPLQPTTTSTEQPSETPSATHTASPMPSSTLTLTATATHTHTATPTFTYTPSFTATYTATNTPTATATATATATRTPSPTPTVTRTPSPTHTATMTRTMTITPFPTLTITPFMLPPSQIACVPNPDWEPYVVQSGDILFEIALASGLRTDALRQANCIEGSDIVAGQTILVPPDSPLLQSQPTQAATTAACQNPNIQITYPRGGEVLNGPFAVRGIADDDFFGYYVLRVAPNPDTAFTVYESSERVSSSNVIGTVNLPEFPVGNYTLRLVVFNAWGSVVDYCDVGVTFAR